MIFCTAFNVSGAPLDAAAADEAVLDPGFVPLWSPQAAATAASGATAA